LTGVYAVDEKGVVTYRLVRVGKNYGDKVEILSGLNAGEKIITAGVEKAIDGGVIK
jgi:multidrug efflux pump subunit AcrA (membrane-fusion protein)